MVTQALVAGTSPCGPNCTYSIEMIYPSLICSNESFGFNLPERMAPFWTQYAEMSPKEFAASDFYYLSEMYPATSNTTGTPIPTVVEFMEYGTHYNEHFKCPLYETVGMVDFKYVDGVQTITPGEIIEQHLFDQSVLSKIYKAGYNESLTNTKLKELNLTDHIDGTVAALSEKDRTSANIFGLFIGMGTNWRGFSLVTEEGWRAAGDTFGLGGSWPAYSWDIAANYMEDTFFNLSMSFVNIHPNRHVLTDAATSNYSELYKFDNLARFFVPYAVTLVVSFVILLFNLLALRSNGVSANSGFLQVMCTTAGMDERIKNLAIKASCGGYEMVPAELKEMEVNFGSVKCDGDSSQMGFRLAGEHLTTPPVVLLSESNLSPHFYNHASAPGDEKSLYGATEEPVSPSSMSSSPTDTITPDSEYPMGKTLMDKEL